MFGDVIVAFIFCVSVILRIKCLWVDADNLATEAAPEPTAGLDLDAVAVIVRSLAIVVKFMAMRHEGWLRIEHVFADTAAPLRLDADRVLRIFVPLPVILAPKPLRCRAFLESARVQLSMTDYVLSSGLSASSHGKDGD